MKSFLNVLPLTIVNLLLWPFKVSSLYYNIPSSLDLSFPTVNYVWPFLILTLQCKVFSEHYDTILYTESGFFHSKKCDDLDSIAE
mgnify:CR=1 FL=1